ncbi:MAG: hypothetical protein GWO44_08830, partial [Thermoplasmata archaeon]|nr:hypothetical protein [Thermoplasmata archaeon]NIY03379.1 hypothetical protein [Thermoplasmata archaeon]
MSYANGLVPLSPVNVDKFLLWRRKIIKDRTARYYIIGSILAFITLFGSIAILESGSGCCSLGVFGGVIALVFGVVTLVGWGMVVEEPHGYWKRSDMSYDRAVENLEKLLSDEEYIAFEKADVARFFEVDTKTTFYLLEMSGPPPVYIIVWKDGNRAVFHLGPRTDDDPDRLKPLSKKIAWSV